jgi:hypothetical protein
MPAFQPEIILIDSTHKIVLEPVDNENNLATFSGLEYIPDPADPLGSVVNSTAAALSPQLTVSLNRPSKSSRVAKTRIKLVVPQGVLATDGSLTAVKDRESSFDITFISSERATTEERQKMVDYCIGVLSNSYFRTIPVDLKSIY